MAVAGCRNFGVDEMGQPQEIRWDLDLGLLLRGPDDLLWPEKKKCEGEIEVEEGAPTEVSSHLSPTPEPVHHRPCVRAANVCLRLLCVVVMVHLVVVKKRTEESRAVVGRHRILRTVWYLISKERRLISDDRRVDRRHRRAIGEPPHPRDNLQKNVLEHAIIKQQNDNSIS